MWIIIMIRTECCKVKFRRYMFWYLKSGQRAKFILQYIDLTLSHFIYIKLEYNNLQSLDRTGWFTKPSYVANCMPSKCASNWTLFLTCNLAFLLPYPVSYKNLYNHLPRKYAVAKLISKQRIILLVFFYFKFHCYKTMQRLMCLLFSL